MTQLNGEGTSSSASNLKCQFVKSPEIPTYPTGSLDFLVNLQKKIGEDKSEPAVSGSHSQKPKLNILIVGAGLGGLAAAIALARNGHRVTVFEQAAELGEVGAGIQIPPNSSRLLLKWGLEPFLTTRVVEPGSISIRRWQSGEVIGLTKLVPEFRENFDAPYYVVHRAHFHDAMYKLALTMGVDIKVDSKVVDYHMDTPSITLHNDKVYEADLIIAADGLKSIARVKILDGVDQPPLRTGFAAYRATVDAEKMKADTDTASLMEKAGLNLWLGDNRHVMTYTIAAGKSFNMVLSHPDETDPSTWDQSRTLLDMRKHFSGWDPRLIKIINMIQSTLKWPLLSGSALDRWIAPSQKVLIMGDAAHAMLPYMSQGAAMAVEDAAALAESIDQIHDISELPAALQLWERVRIKRTSQMQQASLINGKLWHFADGPEQHARDAGMQPEVHGRQFLRSPNQWSDPTTQRWCYDYDAEQSIRDAWKSNVDGI